MVKIKIAGTAKKDIKAIYEYVSSQSLQNAELLVQALYDKIDILYRFPEIGQIVKEIDSPSFRELKLFRFRIIYRYADNNIVVLTIHHSSRMLLNNPHLRNLFE